LAAGAAGADHRTSPNPTSDASELG